MDLEDIYCTHVKSSFDLNLLEIQMNFAMMLVWGRYECYEKAITKATFLHCDNGVSQSFHRTIRFSNLMKENPIGGLATDGDADRIGLYNSSGNFIDSHL